MGNGRCLHVAQAGLLTVVQDRGRFGWEGLGIPRGGAVDWYAAAWANRLAQNPLHLALLEAALLGPVLEMSQDTWIATTGASVTVDGQPRPPWAGFLVRAGSTVSIKTVQRVRAYLAVHSGIAVPEVLGSRSTNLESGFGGFEGRALRAGDELPVGDLPLPDFGSGQALGHPNPPPVLQDSAIRVVPGPHEVDFPADAKAVFYGSVFRVSPQSNHMGVRLDGPAIPAPPRGSRISEPMPIGGIQITPAGQAIALLRARGTIGGYPLLATIITRDTWTMGQMRPGQEVRFEAVGVERAQALARDAYAELEHMTPVVVALEDA